MREGEGGEGEGGRNDVCESKQFMRNICDCLPYVHVPCVLVRVWSAPAVSLIQQ